MSLRQRLAQKAIVIAPGVYDAFTASMAASAGFEALYVSGAAIAYTRLGQPDIGLVSMSEVADTVALIRDRVGAHLIVDGDTGFGNALNVQRTVRVFERAGASAIQLEDQTFPKRCGHLADKTVIAAVEMAGKITAACDARRNEETLIIARTDALAIEGLAAACDRAALYADAGADVLFVEAPKTADQLRQLTAALGRRLPLLANMVEGGTTPVLGAAELQDIGFSIVIFPGGIVRAIACTAQEYYQSLQVSGSTAGFTNRMFDFNGLNAILGTPDVLAQGKRYETMFNGAEAKAVDPASRNKADKT